MPRAHDDGDDGQTATLSMASSSTAMPPPRRASVIEAERAMGDELVLSVAQHCVQVSTLAQWRTFMEAHCHKFEENVSEYNLEHTRVHRLFVELIEGQIADYLAELHETPATFYEACAASASNGDDDETKGPDGEPFTDAFVRVVLMAIDFEAFADCMAYPDRRDYFFSIIKMWSSLLNAAKADALGGKQKIVKKKGFSFVPGR